MSVFRAVVAELTGMFLSDARLTFGAIAVVALAALAAEIPDPGHLAAGAVLLLGCVGVLVVAIMATARRRR